MDNLPRFPTLTPDDRVWRLDWLGEIAYPGAVRQYRQPCIRVAISPLLGSPDSFSLSGSFGTDLSEQRNVWVSLGALSMLRIGDLWQHGRSLNAPHYSLAGFDLDIAPDTTTFVKAGLAIDDNYLIPFSEHPWHRHHTQSYCLMVKASENENLIIPGAELVRFYFGSSSNLVKRLAAGPFQEETLWQEKTYNAETRHLHLKLASGLSGASATDIGRIAVDAHAQRSAAGIYSHIVKATAQRETAHLYTGFPFRGKTTLAATGTWLSFAGRPKSTFLVFNLRSCSHPFPFASFTYEASDRVRRKSAGATVAGQDTARSAHQRNAKSEAAVEQGDPGARKSPRRFSFDHTVRFPDLRRKSVWRERFVAAGATEMLIKHADGTLEKLAFGEPEGGGEARALDIGTGEPKAQVAEIALEQLPHFVQVGISMVMVEYFKHSSQITTRPLVPFGRTEPVFAFPMIVDTDGVIVAARMHLGPNGEQRLKHACFVAFFEGDQEVGKLAVIEGKDFRAPPAVVGVRSTDIVELIRRL